MKIGKLLRAGTVIVVIASAIWGCSNSNQGAPAIQDGKHPAGWAAAGTGGSHPAAYLNTPAQCVQCHGADLLGGISKVSCFSTTFAGIACHPGGPSSHPVGFAAPVSHGPHAKAALSGNNGFAFCQRCHGTAFAGAITPDGKTSASCVACHGVPAPHPPRPWRGTQFTHTNTDPTNAALCAQCHTKGANLDPALQQGNYVNGTPGCFNSTLCHGQVGHVAGWASPDMHGKSAKAVPSPTEGMAYCRNCHGTDLHGGTGAPSCFSTSFDGNSCHTTAPHSPTPWRDPIRTHTNTATLNADVCILCHLNNQRLTTPGTVPPGTVPDCFNGSMCHATAGHPAGWSNPSQHGVTAKDHPTGSSGFSSCQTANCHGATFTGSTGIPSCINNTPCHGANVAAPHPKLPWLNSPLTHTNTATENAVTCSACHLGGANLTLSFKTKYNPTATPGVVPSCINNTMCHPNLGNCASCHSSQQGTGRRPVIGPPTPPDGTTGALGNDFALASHHVKLATLIDQDTCTVCHDQAQHKTVSANGVSVLLYDQNDVNSLATVLFDGTPTNNGERFCVSCHDAGAAIRLGPNASQPFYESNDFTTPPNIGWTVGQMAHSATMACFNCHGNSAGVAGNTLNPLFNGHGSATAKLLQFAGYNPAASNTDPANICYNCHGATAATAGTRNIQAQFAKTGSIHSTPVCSNCHDKHQAKSGTHTVSSNLAGGALNGALGTALTTNPAFFTAPTAANFASLAAINAGTDLQASLCFKCHSAAKGSALGTSPSGGYAMTDQAKEFNPNNVGNFAGTWAANETAGSFHPVLATAGSNLGAVRLTNLVTTSYPWSTTARNLMTCGDCHGSDAGPTDPNGPHGSAASFILKGPNTLWNTSLNAGSGSMPAGTFCANCHSATYAGSRYPAHTNPNHNIPCFSCHVAIPHGSAHPGLLHAKAGVAAGVPVNAETNASPYFQSSGTLNVFIKSYPVNNTTNWSQSNCGCNGTSH